MSGYTRYIHIERLDSEEVDGILDGHVIVTPKIDGTNASVWLDDGGVVGAGSRNRPLSVDDDNCGFAAWVESCDPEAAELRAFCAEHPALTVFGEFLVPNAIKDYDEWAWRHLFVFDVYDRGEGRYLADEEWRPLVAGYENIRKCVVPILAEFDSPSLEDLERVMLSNRYLLEGAGHAGEGVVVRRPGFVNACGRYAVAKIVRKEAVRISGSAVARVVGEHVEEDILERWLTESELEKAAARAAARFGVDALDAGDPTHVGMFQSLVFRGAILDEIADIVGKTGEHAIDFGRLEGLSDRAALEYLRNLGSNGAWP